MSFNYSLFIARRLMSGHNGQKRLSGPVIKVATAAVALGVAVMTISLSVGLGFKKEIRDKIVGFGTHVQIVSLDMNRSYETNPIRTDSVLCQKVTTMDGVRSMQPYILKPGIIKTTDAFQGIALKGVDNTFNWDFIASIMEEGDVLQLPDSAMDDGILMSRELASLLKLQIGDPVRMYFIQNGVRARRFNLAGIFNSHFPEFDGRMAFVDLRKLRQLNGWDDNQITGYEVLLSDFDLMERVADDISEITTTHVGPEDNFLTVNSIRDLQPQMFGWLSLLDMNIVVILTLIMAVAGLNMISGLLILILENTNMIGILKAMGSSNKKIRRIFIYMAVYIIGRGMIVGNVIGIGICVVQSLTGIIALDPENYYLDTVPILLSPVVLILMNVGTLVLTTFMLVAPSFAVARITPAKSIRFN